MINRQMLQKTVKDLLGSVGQQYTLIKQVSGEYDPSLGTAPVVEETYQYLGGVFNYTTKGSGDGTVYNKLIEQGDRKILLVPREDKILPEIGNWSIVIGTERWAVVAVEVVAPANLQYLIELQVRKR
jgi:hypothetical protein